VPGADGEQRRTPDLVEDLYATAAALSRVHQLRADLRAAFAALVAVPASVPNLDVDGDAVDR
jgi:hypothetical protein